MLSLDEGRLARGESREEKRIHDMSFNKSHKKEASKSESILYEVREILESGEDLNKHKDKLLELLSTLDIHTKYTEAEKRNREACEMERADKPTEMGG